MFAAATVFAYGCSDNFDDSALWKDIDGMYKSLNELKAQVTTMQQQLDALAAVVSGGAVTSITQDADGHYVLSYKDADNVEHTIDIATMDDANTQPIIGMKADGEIYYWTVTTGGKTSWLLDTDGAKIPVTGRTPEIGVDDQGYWTLFGKRITDASGNPVKAEGKSAGSVAVLTTYSGGTRVQASSTQTGTMLAELGASNITDADKSLLSDYSLESLVKADPDFIFLLPMGDSDEAAQKALKDQTTANPAWKELTAVKKDRVITLDPKLFLYKPNNNWDDAYEELYEALYEDQHEQK